jgi:hypothetical protein
MKAAAGTGRWAVVADGRRKAFFWAWCGTAAWGEASAMSEVAAVELRDGKGATNGSGAQHGSEADPWTARPRPVAARRAGGSPTLFCLV